VRLLKQTVRDAQPIAKGLTIKTLKSTIALLEGQSIAWKGRPCFH
jgi:hypothetical protein